MNNFSFEKKITFGSFSKKIFINLFLFSFFFILSKYIFSLFILKDVSLIFKIIYFSDTEYFDIVESLSRFDIYLNRSVHEISNKIFGFPFFALLIHSFFYKIIGVYSFLLLEFFFNFILLLILYKIFFQIFSNKELSFSLVATFYLILLFIELGLSLDILSNFLTKLHLPIVDFIGSRFPRPLLTSLAFFLVIYYNIKILVFKGTNKVLNLTIISLLLAFLINSFFFTFLTCFILSFFNLYKIILNKIKNFLSFILPCLIGLLILIIQQKLSEPNYELRIGMHYIDNEQKIYLIKYFIKKIFQKEILFLLIFNTSFIIYFYKKKVNNFICFKILYISFLSSLLSPIVFVTISEKVISLYYFWTTVKFLGAFLLVISIFYIFMNMIQKINIYIISAIFLIVCITKNYLYVVNFNNQLTYELNQIHQYIKKNYKKSDLTFVGVTEKIKFNHRVLDLLWLTNENEKIMYPPGFSSNLSDTQLENLIFTFYKSLQISNKDFEKILNDNSCGRNCFARLFSHKYSVNKIRFKENLKEQYKTEDQAIILSSSPIIWWNLKISNSEKIRLLNKYKNFKINRNFGPDILIVDKNHKFFPEISYFKNFEKTYETLNYFDIYKKKSMN